MVHKLWFPGPYITYFSSYQEFEAIQCRFVKKLRFSVILGAFLQENLTFLTAVYLERLVSEKYIIEAGLIDEINVSASNIWG